MRIYNVWQLGIVIAYWKEAECAGKLYTETGHGAVSCPQEIVEKSYRPMAQYSRDVCTSAELTAAVNRLAKLEIAFRYNFTWQELRNQAQVLREAIESELPYRRFAILETAKANTLDRVSQDWSAVWGKFPETKEDTERAIECYALEQNTACVFHLMRVAEFGLRAIAKKVGVKLRDKGKPQPVEFATWEKVIAAIKNKITAAHGMAKGPRRKQQLQFHSDAADQCTYIRDVWRNEVAHTRGTYSDGEAQGVITRVRQFMEMLAKEV